MAAAPLPQSLRDLFTTGTTAGLDDGALLARFRSSADETAFETLVVRHGPMVWRVCRDLLADEHAAEDAFQATFLVLVRKAGSVRVDDSLGRWLHGVAWRVAQHARADLLRRRQREGGTLLEPADDADGEADRRELRAIVQAELARLPERFRAPIVLCHLEGLSHEEAARQLRCPVGTVRSRLARGRDRLRDRLARLGAPAVFVPTLEPAAVPVRLLTATVRSAVAWGKGAGLISASVLSLTKGALIAMTFAHWKLVATGLAAAGLVGVAGNALVAHPEPAAAPAPPPLPLPAAPDPLVLDRREDGSADQPSTGELAVRLQFAEERLQMTIKMRDAALASGLEVVKAKEEVAVLKSRMEALEERLQEEYEQLALERDTRHLEWQMARANIRSLSERVDWLDKLREKQAAPPGEYTEAKVKLDIAKADEELKVARFHDAIRRVDRAHKRLNKLKVLQGKKPDCEEEAPQPPAPAPAPAPGAAE